MSDGFQPPHDPVGQYGDSYDSVFSNMVDNFNAFMRWAENRVDRELRDEGAVIVPIRRPSVQPIPTASIELEEDELSALCDQFVCTTVAEDHPLARAILKLNQAYAIESAPGGNFSGDAA